MLQGFVPKVFDPKVFDPKVFNPKGFNPKAIVCLERAAAAEQRACDAKDVELRAEHLGMADRWRKLARSFEFVESVNRFLQSCKHSVRVIDPRDDKG